MRLSERYKAIRSQTFKLVELLNPEDMVAQAEEFVSPPKWHLAHSTWFFETFVLKNHAGQYQEFDPAFHFLFNSYYESLGQRVARNHRGLLNRPLVKDVLEYRGYVDRHMESFMNGTTDKSILNIIELGLQHEQQHQELLVTDTKYMFSLNPLLPAWKPALYGQLKRQDAEMDWLNIHEGVYEIGHQGSEFCFDNELPRHKQYIHEITIANRPVTNGDFLGFVNGGGYDDFSLWLSDGWAWVNGSGAKAPLYWQKKEGQWFSYGFEGLQKVDPGLPAMHLNYYEADAFARWNGCRLPTEFEHETAARLFPDYFKPCVWEWTQSAYLPYPGFKSAAGAVGEYNGKFMINQMVLKGGSIATPELHARPTYRNFFNPAAQWQFSGIRLVNDNSVKNINL